MNSFHSQETECLLFLEGVDLASSGIAEPLLSEESEPQLFSPTPILPVHSFMKDFFD